MALKVIGSNPIIHQLLIIFKKKKITHFLKNFNFFFKNFKITITKKFKILKFLIIVNNLLFKYYNLLNFFILKNNNSKNINNFIFTLSLNFNKLFFTITSLKIKKTKLTFSLNILLKILKIFKKNRQFINRNLPIILTYLNKNVFKKFKLENLILNLKILKNSYEIINIILNFFKMLNIKTILISKKLSFSFRKKKSIRNIKRRLKKKLIKLN